MMMSQRRLECLTQAAQQMPPVGHLDGTGRSRAGGLGIRAGAIAADNLHAGMGPQPLRHCLRGSVGQQIDNATSFQIAKYRSVAMAFAPCPIVDAQDSWHRRGATLSVPSAKLAQQRAATDRPSETPRQSRSCLSTRCQRNPVQRCDR
jgi:hypothetical protein